MKKTMASICAIALAVVLLLAFSACGGAYIMKGCVETNNGSGVNCKYQYFQGTRMHRLTVLKGETVEVTVNTTTESGKLNMRIELLDRKADYQGKDLGNTSFVVTLTNPSVYTISVTGEEHKGSYSVAWKTIK